MVRIGVLALQGGVAEHVAALSGLGAGTCLVRRPADLEGLDGVVLPGGESTVFDRLARAFGLAGPLAEAISGGLPTLATCAGLIYLAARIEDAAPGQQSLGVLDITVRRNAFGTQLDSFETSVQVQGLDAPVAAAFIRAPLVTAAGDGVEVTATLDDDRIVGVRQGRVSAYAFHPEETGDRRLHRAWLDSVVARPSRLTRLSDAVMRAARAGLA